MSTPTEYPTLTIEGRTYVLVPVDDFDALTGGEPWIPEGDAAPWAVVRRHIEEGVGMARAWREHLGLTQQEVAERMGVSQSALSQIEHQTKPRKATLEKLARALGVRVDQLRG